VHQAHNVSIGNNIEQLSHDFSLASSRNDALGTFGGRALKKLELLSAAPRTVFKLLGGLTGVGVGGPLARFTSGKNNGSRISKFHFLESRK